jgi:L-ribulokinase
MTRFCVALLPLPAGGGKMDKKYSIGIDFGTLSARAVLLDLVTGKDAAVSELIYPHSVLSSDFFGKELPVGASLQHPRDYLDAMGFVFRDLFVQSGAKPEEVCGVGIDFTASTTMPVTADGTPLCFLPELQNEPYAYVTLWNHHCATPEAEHMTAIAKKRNEPWLAAYSGKVSPDNMLPKLYELLHKAPHI